MISRNKGQGTIAEVILFSLVILSSIFTYYVMVSSGNTFDTNVEKGIETQLGELRKKSVMTLTMKDHMWRAESIPNTTYRNRPAKEILSLYYSTPNDEDKMYVGAEVKDVSQVRQDIITYLEYQMQTYWGSIGNPVDYYISIASEKPNPRPEIVVSNYDPNTGSSKTVYPIALTDGDKAYVVMWAKTRGDISAVQASD